MFPHLYEVTGIRRHTKAKRAIRALALFGMIISVLLIAFESVSLGFGISNSTVIPVNQECQLSYCYTGAGLWSGVLGILASTFGIVALRSCNSSRGRHGVYFLLCLVVSLGDIMGILIGWECDKSLFDCLRYHQEEERIDRAIKIMATMYSCLLLEAFVHMVSSNASIGFALYNWCLPEPYHCELCDSIIRSAHHTVPSHHPISYEIPERVSNRNKIQQTCVNDFNQSNYTQSLPRYFFSSKPTSV